MTELSDIRLMDVNPTKRTLQLKLLGQVFTTGFQSGPPITVACLPGNSAWDIDYFLQKERVGRIVGIERDARIAAGLHARFEGEDRVEIVNKEVGEYLAETSEQVDLLYLDYCSPFNLALMQDIDLCLRRRVLRKYGKGLISFLNARESVADQLAQRLLFDDLEEVWPSGEQWEQIDRDRRRCISFNALLMKYRCLPINRRSGRAGEWRPTYVGASAVRQWFKYSTGNGCMLSGYFGLRSYGNSTLVKPQVVSKCPDLWFVRGKKTIQVREDIECTAALSNSSRTRGRDIVKDLTKKKIKDFYEKHGYPPGILQLGIRGGVEHSWLDLVREVGLCPNRTATLEDIRGELRRIRERHSVITREHLKRARLLNADGKTTGREAMHEAYGWNIGAYVALLGEMDIKYDFRTVRQKQYDTDIKAWVEHLESNKPKMAFPKYNSMVARRLLKYEDAVTELRRREQATENVGPHHP